VATFDIQYAHGVLLILAEAAYDANEPTNLPPDFAVVGPITVNQAKANAFAATASPQYSAMLAAMRAQGDRFGWVFQDLQHGAVVISFRGTALVQDWLNDFDFLPDVYQLVANFGKVHRGFQAVYLSVRDSVLSQLRAANQNYKRLILTGHSLGAAVSELAAPDLLRNATPNAAPEVQNFAGPRAGLHDFASVFDVEIDICFRVVNLWDIVPQLPPPLDLFEHVGTAVRIDGGFTLDELVAHSLDQSYGPGLSKLMPQPVTGVRTSAVTATGFPTGMLVGREP